MKKRVIGAAVTLLVVLGIYFGLVQYIGSPTIFYTTTDKVDATNSLPEINAGFIYTQEINCEYDGLDRIDLRYGAWDLTNVCEMYLTLRNQDGNVIQEWTLSSVDIHLNDYYGVTLDEPLYHSKGQTYYIDVTSNALPGDGITVFTNSDGNGCSSMGTDFGCTMVYTLGYRGTNLGLILENAGENPTLKRDFLIIVIFAVVLTVYILLIFNIGPSVMYRDDRPWQKSSCCFLQ